MPTFIFIISSATRTSIVFITWQPLASERITRNVDIDVAFVVFGDCFVFYIVLFILVISYVAFVYMLQPRSGRTFEGLGIGGVCRWFGIALGSESKSVEFSDGIFFLCSSSLGDGVGILSA